MACAKGVALITRSTGVTGRATALQLAADGFDVAISDDDSQQDALAQLQRELQLTGVQCKSYVTNLLSEESIKSLIEAVVADMGGIDVMFVNALKLSVCLKPVCEISSEEWDDAFANNTRSAFMCYKYAATQMKQNRGGRIIVNASTNSVQPHLPNMSALTASTFALRGLSQAAALELGPHNITVNVIAAGPLDRTDDGPYGYKLGEDTYDRVAREFSTSSESLKPIRQIVSDRMSLPQKSVTGQEIARVVGLLAAKDFNFMTGQTIYLSGGIW